MPDLAGLSCEQSRTLDVLEVPEEAEGLERVGQDGPARIMVAIGSSVGM